MGTFENYVHKKIGSENVERIKNVVVYQREKAEELVSQIMPEIEEKLKNGNYEGSDEFLKSVKKYGGDENWKLFTYILLGIIIGIISLKLVAKHFGISFEYIFPKNKPKTPPKEMPEPLLYKKYFAKDIHLPDQSNKFVYSILLCDKIIKDLKNNADLETSIKDFYKDPLYINKIFRHFLKQEVVDFKLDSPKIIRNFDKLEIVSQMPVPLFRGKNLSGLSHNYATLDDRTYTISDLESDFDEKVDYLLSIEYRTMKLVIGHTGDKYILIDIHSDVSDTENAVIEIGNISYIENILYNKYVKLDLYRKKYASNDVEGFMALYFNISVPYHKNKVVIGGGPFLLSASICFSIIITVVCMLLILFLVIYFTEIFYCKCGRIRS